MFIFLSQHIVLDEQDVNLWDIFLLRDQSKTFGAIITALAQQNITPERTICHLRGVERFVTLLSVSQSQCLGKWDEIPEESEVLRQYISSH